MNKPLIISASAFLTFILLAVGAFSCTFGDGTFCFKYGLLLSLVPFFIVIFIVISLPELTGWAGRKE